jgi:hypothetical protein
MVESRLQATASERKQNAASALTLAPPRLGDRLGSQFLFIWFQASPNALGAGKRILHTARSVKRAHRPEAAR